MAIAARPAVLDAGAQAMLAFWAVKTVLLVQLAFRQMYGSRRELRGYDPASQLFAWLWASRQPPPRSMVWLSAWDCQQADEACRVNFEPSEAPPPTADGVPVAGDMTTITLGYVVFQVFTVEWPPNSTAPATGIPVFRSTWTWHSRVSGRLSAATSAGLLRASGTRTGGR
jgi:hypothetical protein